MTAKELIKRYRIFLAGGDKIGIPGGDRLSAEVLEQIKAMKPQILAELKAQKAEEEARRQAEIARREAEREAIRSGREKITVHYYDGEYLSGYQVLGEAEELLAALGLARYISGWGYLVDEEVVRALGEEFTYPDALAYAERRKAEKEAAAKPAVDRQAKIDEAKRIGAPVEIRRWTEPCNNPREECSLDIVIEWALPDGTTKIEREHTW